MTLKPRFLLALSLSAFACIACSGKPPVKEIGAPLVAVAPPVESEVADTVELDGTVAPSESVDLVARVSGYLQAAPFAEGQPVKQGQLLFVIEPESYQQQVKLNLAKVEAARAEYQRQQVLIQQNATAQSSLESALSNLRQAEANQRLAEINLGYTQVRAPFDGVIGKRAVDVGNYVGAGGNTLLATLLRVKPAYVEFTLSERELLRLRDRQGGPGRTRADKLKVSVALQGETAPSEQGQLDFIDTNLSASTGSLKLRAVFDNKDLRLIPGLYGRVSIAIGQPHRALLLPNTVIQSDQIGNYVYVVDRDSKVVRREVKTGSDYGQLREITQGLVKVDRVITEGLSNVGPGQQVAVQGSHS